MKEVEAATVAEKKTSIGKILKDAVDEIKKDMEVGAKDKVMGMAGDIDRARESLLKTFEEAIGEYRSLTQLFSDCFLQLDGQFEKCGGFKPQSQSLHQFFDGVLGARVTVILGHSWRQTASLCFYVGLEVQTR